ncbi:hypothetical protein AAC387_Pa07g2570 [Persea americana]
MFLFSFLNAFRCHLCSVPKQQKKLEQKLLLSKWGEKDKKRAAGDLFSLQLLFNPSLLFFFLVFLYKLMV